jgi:hypothetical protein
LAALEKDKPIETGFRAEKMFAKIGMAYMLNFISEQIRRGSKEPAIAEIAQKAFKKDLAALTPDERHKFADFVYERSLETMKEAVKAK